MTNSENAQVSSNYCAIDEKFERLVANSIAQATQWSPESGMRPPELKKALEELTEYYYRQRHSAETCEQSITRQTLESWALVASDPDKYGEKDWAETFRRALGRSSEKASEPHAWHFNRYRNGRLMAEGVTVHTATEAEAWEKAESLKRQFQLPTDELRLSQSEGEDRG